MLVAVALLAATACRDQKAPSQFIHKPMRGIYHWKTTFSPTEGEIDFIKRHKVGRLYIHYFDVVLRDGVVQPEATVYFDRMSVLTLPDSLEIVPTVYITTEAMTAIKNEPDDYVTPDEVASAYAQRILTRILAMTRHNEVPGVHEVQLDCDWTANLAVTYFGLVKKVRDLLHSHGMTLSVTIRLHQLKGACPPADMGVLMLYNTGNLMAENTRNSILDIDDVKPYFNVMTSYDLPLDFAVPDFGWQVCFRDGKFLKLASAGSEVPAQCHVRTEQADYATIMEVMQLARGRLRHPHGQSAIIYHLDEPSLNHFSHNEIENIYGLCAGFDRR